MPQVSIAVNGMNYLVACDDGEEPHLQDLAQYLDKHVRDLAVSVGNVGETRLLLMAGLLLADELAEMLTRIEQLEGEVERLRTSRPGAGDRVIKTDSVAIDVLEAATRRLEDLAGKVEALQ